MFQLAPVQSLYGLLLAPAPPFTWLGLPFSILDTIAAVRLVLIVRQLRDLIASEEIKKNGGKQSNWELSSFLRDFAPVVTVLCGGEAANAALLGFQPSFIITPTYLLFYAAVQCVVSALPAVPPLCLETELPWVFIDGLARSFLLCKLLPPAIIDHANKDLANSPYSLLIGSFLGANTGFFFVNLFGMLHPAGFTLSTPMELRAWGWTQVDLWCAPLITGLYAFWTHAQPWWARLHVLSLGYTEINDKILQSTAVDPDTAMARCAVILMVLFGTRTVRNFGPTWWAKYKSGNRVSVEKKTE